MINKNILLVLLSVSCLALGGIFVKISILGPISTGVYRVLFSLPVFFYLTRYSKEKISLRDKLISMSAGVFLAFDLILWNISFSFTTVANANLLANLVPFTVVPLSYFIYKERISRQFLVGGSVIFLGLIILLSGKLEPDALNFKGDLLALSTSIFYGLFIITIYRLRQSVSTIYIMAYASIGALLTLTPVAIVMEGVQIPLSLQAIAPLLGLAILSQVIGQGGLSYCLGKIPANLASLLVLTQPLISAVYAFILFKEKISPIELLGIIVVLFGLYVANMKINTVKKIQLCPHKPA